MTIIHATDPTTQVLSLLYQQREDVRLLVTERSTSSDVQRAIRADDVIMMLGHGNEYGLFSKPNKNGKYERFLITDKHVQFLRDKTCIGIWCYANKFAEKYRLHGLFSGMIISELQESIDLGVPATKDEIARFIANLYFAIKKGEYGTSDEDYPTALFSDLNLQAIVCNSRYVTYQEYTHDYNGGAHGFYTERLVSYDHVHQQEIDCDYLFQPERMNDVLSILLDEAKKTSQYKEWEPNIMDYVTNRDEDGNETGGFTLPTPGLSEDGIVFSFQPYAISCFAAGTFHFTIPYSRISHCLTTRGKWCAGLN